MKKFLNIILLILIIFIPYINVNADNNQQLENSYQIDIYDNYKVKVKGTLMFGDEKGQQKTFNLKTPFNYQFCEFCVINNLQINTTSKYEIRDIKDGKEVRLRLEKGITKFEYEYDTWIEDDIWINNKNLNKPEIKNIEFKIDLGISYTTLPLNVVVNFPGLESEPDVYISDDYIKFEITNNSIFIKNDGKISVFDVEIPSSYFKNKTDIKKEQEKFGIHNPKRENSEQPSEEVEQTPEEAEESRKYIENYNRRKWLYQIKNKLIAPFIVLIIIIFILIIIVLIVKKLRKKKE